ncbi:hypothetical protein L1987_76630 [Smallanthus sonchifolius]|uniref:Uncharacterized protein n=1 Tax=Smallanthus sonchifolius TaxID=185202 RepID=A0ACB8Z7I6_9ASTR|nr:hypothetical protein L1987_76630 [Smallanthus sonchifolius]
MKHFLRRLCYCFKQQEMGNYMETCIKRNRTQQQGQKEKLEFGKTSDTLSKESSTVRVKLVLKKDELQWLLLQLKKDEGRKLEEVLGEIEKSRLTVESSVTKWKPCLESIMELEPLDSSSS